MGMTLRSRLRYAFLAACIAFARASYMVTLGPGERECFLIRCPADRASVISGNFDLLDDEVEEGMIAAWLEKSQGKQHSELWRSSEDVDEETFSVEVGPGGRYSLCFESSVEEDADDVYLELSVGFALRLQVVPRTLPDEERGPDMERALKLVESASFIENDWQNLLDHFDFLRNREAVHSTLAQQILGRVMSWTLIEALLVVTMAVGQVMYWKKFFEQRRYL